MNLLRAVYLISQGVMFIIRPVAIGVRVMLVREGQVLLIRQTYVGGWFMPGGGVDRGETLDAAARREASEEAGARLGELKLLGVYTNFEHWKSDHNAVFLCTDFELVGKPDHEIAEARFFPLDALPGGLMRGHRQRLEEYRKHIAAPQFGEW